MAFATGTGLMSVVIGERKWMRWPEGTEWQLTSGGQGAPFSTRRWFRWTPYAQHVRLLDERRRHGRRISELTLFDPGTPVWIRMTVDTATGRVLRERQITKAHFTTQRYRGFNSEVDIEPPTTGDGG